MDRTDGTLLLLSGGLDSVCAWAGAGYPDAVFFRCGTRANAREERALVEVMRATGHINVTFDSSLEWLGAYEDRATGYVPYRNLLFLIRASLMLPPEGGTLLLAQVANEWQRDKNPAFYRDTERMLTGLLGRSVRIRAPIGHLSKREAAIASGLPRDVLALTYSCHAGGERHCGACSACIARQLAIAGLGEFESVPDAGAFWRKAWRNRGHFRLRNLGLYARQVWAAVRGLR